VLKFVFIPIFNIFTKVCCYHGRQGSNKIMGHYIVCLMFFLTFNQRWRTGSFVTLLDAILQMRYIARVYQMLQETSF